MTTFNFGELSNVSAVNTSKYLKPWEIYEVKFDGINQVDIPNKNDESNPYKTVAISFTGESGNFTKTCLFLKLRTIRYVVNMILKKVERLHILLDMKNLSILFCNLHKFSIQKAIPR